MKVSDVISRATYTSGRTTLAVSFILIASGLMEFKLDKLPLISGKDGLSHEQLLKLAIPLVAFLMVSHVLNWLSDRTAFVHEFNYTDDHQKEWEPALRMAFQAWRDTGGFPSDDDQLFPGAQILEFEKILRRQRLTFDTVSDLTNWSTWVSLHIQHLLFPVSMAVWAIWICCAQLLGAAI